MDTRHFHKQLDDAMRRLIGETGVIVCAISGGADSMALLHGLLRVRELRSRTWTLHVAHLDHGIPHDSGDMMAFVEGVATSAGVPFHGAFVDVPALSRETSASIEEAGRKARYAFLERVCDDVRAHALAVAHHADDQAETILHRVVRGTGLSGLAGIPESRPLSDESPVRLIRPMLAFRRSECVAYLERRDLPFMHDDTNDDVLAATRNRIRHDLLPVIEDHINPQAVSAIVRLGEQARQAADLIDEWAKDAWSECHIESRAGAIQFDAHLLARQRELIRMRVVGLAIDRLGAGRGDVGHERLRAAALLIAGERHDAIVELPDGVRVARQGRFVTIARPVGMPALKVGMNQDTKNAKSTRAPKSPRRGANAR
ncbi:MAG TPA: tRNA lysidine(34) synthetase TilS [Phycisphaerae bacterium]|nr:tRNA lysidine(34) synthetase TilS [Phycisphaerae bacterium]HRW55029.1 tRNA lysidine(34) synthetase TilS [Phycisphaerae bacterium]